MDHILSKTNVEKISFVGYSQGTTAFLVFTSMRPQYNARFNDVHLMAPVGYLQGLTQPLMKLAASFYGPLKRLSNLFRVYKLTIDTRFLPKVLRLLCVNDRPPQQNICKVFLNAIAGPNYINIVSSDFDLFLLFKRNDERSVHDKCHVVQKMYRRLHLKSSHIHQQVPP